MSRALIGGNLESTEKTEYEDWLEDVHKKIDSKKYSMNKSDELFDDDASANGYHKDNGEILKSLSDDRTPSNKELEESTIKTFEKIFNECR